mmetsp:Transcript_43718/g.66013  ORF Transcript_43718/g.66013 Transcript_43718/m.66013 type:complete len:203 (-) Transcript_43718:385-993(-)
MHFCSFAKMCPTNVAIEGNRAFTRWIVRKEVRVCEVLVTINNEVGMCISPDKWSILDSGNKECQLLDFILQVLAIDASGEVKHLGSVINLGPKAVLEELFCFAEILHCLELVKVRKNAHDFGETVCLQHVEKLKGLHLEAVLGVHHQQHEVSHFGQVQHGRCVIWALEKCHALIFASHHRHGACHTRQVVVAIHLHHRPNQS